jgi:hypothetical protein
MGILEEAAQLDTPAGRRAWAIWGARGGTVGGFLVEVWRARDAFSDGLERLTRYHREREDRARPRDTEQGAAERTWETARRAMIAGDTVIVLIQLDPQVIECAAEDMIAGRRLIGPPARFVRHCVLLVEAFRGRPDPVTAADAAEIYTLIARLYRGEGWFRRYPCGT